MCTKSRLACPDYKNIYSKDNTPQSYEGRLEVLTSIFKEVSNIYSLSFELTVSGRLKRSLGICSFRRSTKTGTIKMSKFYVETGKWSHVLDTLLHELAHAIDFHKRGTSDHGWRWKSICLEIGADPTRTKDLHTMSEDFKAEVTNKYTWAKVCPTPDCDFKVKYFRKPSAKNQGCPHCNTRRKQIERGSFLRLEIVKL